MGSGHTGHRRRVNQYAVKISDSLPPEVKEGGGLWGKEVVWTGAKGRGCTLGPKEGCALGQKEGCDLRVREGCGCR